MSSLELGATAPEFSFVDELGVVRTLADFRGGPVVVTFPPTQQKKQAYLQLLTFESEQLPVVAAPPVVAASYGVTERFAVFVIASNGTIGWRYVADGTMPPPSSISTLSGLSRRE